MHEAGSTPYLPSRYIVSRQPDFPLSQFTVFHSVDLEAYNRLRRIHRSNPRQVRQSATMETNKRSEYITPTDNWLYWKQT